MKKEFFIVVLLLIFIFGSGLYYAVTNSVTADEKTHIATGYINLKFNDFSFNIEHPPFMKQVSALPLLFMNLQFPDKVYEESSKGMDIVNIQNAFLFGMGNNLDKILILSRLPNMLISMMLGLFIYLYSRKANGMFAGIISLTLFIFSPSFLAHSPLVTMDIAISCFYFAAVYFLMRYFKDNNIKLLTLAALFIGFTLISKYSGLILLPVVYMLVLLRAFDKDYMELKLSRWVMILAVPAIIFVVSYKLSLRIIAPAFLLYATSYIFIKKPVISQRLRSSGKILIFLLVIGFLMVILDYTDYSWFPFHSATKAYFKGLAYFAGHAREGHLSYLLGDYSKTGWWYYFPLAILFKTPFASVVLIVLGFVGLFRSKEGINSKAFLLIPLFAYFFAACFINKVNIGIRHILPVYPFLFVIAGYVVKLSIDTIKAKAIKVIVIAFLLVSVMDSLAAYPAHLSYFNCVTGGCKQGDKYLGDSNIAWGQDYKRLRGYIDENNIEYVNMLVTFKPNNIYGIAERQIPEKEKRIPRKGYYVIDGIVRQKEILAWTENVEPRDYVGSLIIYEIDNEDIERIRNK